MIVTIVKIIGQKRSRCLLFPDNQMPRVGEHIRLGKKKFYIREIAHLFHPQKIANAFPGQTHFVDIESVEITLEAK